MARVRLGVYVGDDGPKLGRGKVRLLRAIQEHRSISGAARSMSMAYRHAWLLVDELNRCFSEPVVRKTIGGREGGGAGLTAWGEELVERFDEMERIARLSLEEHLAALDDHLAKPGLARSRRPTRPASRS